MSEKLKITARYEGRNERHARIGVFQNGGKAGALTVDADKAEAVIKALNLADAAPELLEALSKYSIQIDTNTRLGISTGYGAIFYIGRDRSDPTRWHFTHQSM